MPESKRKKRQRQRKSPQENLTQQVREVTDRYPGASVEAHQLDMYETLSFEIRLPAGYTVAEAVKLSNDLIVAADRTPLDEAPGWRWMITIKWGADQSILLEPCDDLQVICTVCQCIQSRGGVCEDCYSQLPEVPT